MTVLQRARALPSHLAAETRAVPDHVYGALDAPGRPLEAETQALMGRRFGHDFSGVRVHADAAAAASARRLGARAYTVGDHVVFGSREYAPGTREGRRLLAHELEHVRQQGGAGPGARGRSNASSRTGWGRPGATRSLWPELGLGDPRGPAERQARRAADRVMSGAAPEPVGSHAPALQAQPDEGKGPAAAEAKQEPSAADVLVKGLQVVGKQATNDKKVKEKVIEPLKKAAGEHWNRLDAAGKAGAISFGAVTLGGTGALLLTDPNGRKRLAGLNLAAPLQLVPNMPLSKFSFTLPKEGDPAKQQLTFDASLSGDLLLKPIIERFDLKGLSLKVDLKFGFDPASDRLSVLGAQATIGLLPGVTLSAGTYPGLLKAPNVYTGPEGRSIELKESFPAGPKEPSIPDTRVMLKVDLLKLDPGETARRLRRIFGR